MHYVSLGNPIWSAHLHLMGGLRRLGINAAVYGMILIGAFLVMARIEAPDPVSMVAGQAMRILTWIQMGLLVIGGASAIQKGLMRDHQTGMMEFLRTTPMSGAEMIVGQLFGPSMFVITWWLIGLAMGVILATVGGAGGVSEWLYGNMLLLLGAVSAWSIQVFFGVGYAKPPHVVSIIFAILFFIQSADASLRYLPGIALFTGAYGVFRTDAVMRGAVPMTRVLALAMLIIAATLVFWSVAAARRFRRPYLPALNVATALMLLLLWTGCSVLGAMVADQLYPGTTINWEGRGVMAVVMLQTLFILAGMPVASAVLTRRRVIMGAAPLNATDTWPSIVTAFAGASIVVCGVVAISRVLGAPALTWAGCAVAATIGVLLAYGLLSLSVFATGKTGVGWALLLLCWGVPVGLAALIVAIGQQTAGAAGNGEFGLLFASSPLGTAIATWQEVPAPISSGLIVQAALAAGTLALGAWAERGFRARRRRQLISETHELAAGV